jgi:hypothetical protein
MSFAVELTACAARGRGCHPISLPPIEPMSVGAVRSAARLALSPGAIVDE